jgi:hypothetical protein
VDVTIEPSPKEFALLQNFPNPFNPSTTIEYSLEKDVWVTLTVFNLIGVEMTKLVNGPQAAGTYTISFNANAGNEHLSSGVYFYRLEAGTFIATKKLTLMN